MTLQEVINQADALSVEDRKTLLNHIIESLGVEAWSVANGSPEMFLAAIQEAIAQDAPEVAWALAERGYELHPESTQLEEAARALAAPDVIEMIIDALTPFAEKDVLAGINTKAYVDSLRQEWDEP